MRKNEIAGIREGLASDPGGWVVHRQRVTWLPSGRRGSIQEVCDSAKSGTRSLIAMQGVSLDSPGWPQAGSQHVRFGSFDHSDVRAVPSAALPDVFAITWPVSVL